MSATQLALGVCDWPNNPRLSPFAVQVNEIHVNLYAPRETSTWWAECYCRPSEAGRLCIEDSVLPGDIVHVHCADREAADWLHGHLLDRGIAKAALKIIKTTCGANGATP